MAIEYSSPTYIYKSPTGKESIFDDPVINRGQLSGYTYVGSTGANKNLEDPLVEWRRNVGVEAAKNNQNITWDGNSYTMTPASMTASVQPANIPPVTTPATGGSAVTSGNAAITSLGGLLNQPETPTAPTTPVAQTSNLTDLLRQSLGMMAANTPPSSSTIYSEEAQKRQIAEQQAAVQEQRRLLRNAQAKMQSINAEIQGVADTAKQNTLKLEQEAAGRGITTAILNRQQAEVNRQAAIEVLPLQAKALGQQAIVASMQGDLTTAQEALSTAQGQVDKATEMRYQDAQAYYNRQNDLINAVYQFASKEQQAKLDEKKTQEAQALTLKRDNLQVMNEWAKVALNNGQTDVMADITRLDPSSPTFQNDLARLQAKITPAAEKVNTSVVDLGGRKVLINSQTGDVIKYLEGGTGGVSGPTSEQSNDPFLVKLAQTAGGKPISDTFAVKIDKAMTVLGQIGALQENIKNTDTGPIVGAFRGANPWDTNAQVIKAQLNAIVPNLARGVFGEVGVLTDNDIAQYSKTLPNLTSTNDIRNAILGITVDMVAKSVKKTLEVNAANGKDVSGFVDLYSEMTNTRDGIFSSIPGYKGYKAQGDLSEFFNEPSGQNTIIPPKTSTTAAITNMPAGMETTLNQPKALPGQYSQFFSNFNIPKIEGIGSSFNFASYFK